MIFGIAEVPVQGILGVEIERAHPLATQRGSQGHGQIRRGGRLADATLHGDDPDDAHLPCQSRSGFSKLPWPAIGRGDGGDGNGHDIPDAGRLCKVIKVIDGLMAIVLSVFIAVSMAVFMAVCAACRGRTTFWQWPSRKGHSGFQVGERGF
ncbi:hypothetical protein Cenrod_1589 [Candidatus Symbiobacter mobilis CR]|uniref:Uncharacterized protein n=1 Tax=Candidatus Symbiobacter mobilis CR TaxID=946483 RepID=U5NBW5_9BURK|nr:hypothetical protein Cenrod_1589 [Candidatus Symbiobacter mobilis CR]